MARDSSKMNTKQIPIHTKIKQRLDNYYRPNKSRHVAKFFNKDNKFIYSKKTYDTYMQAVERLYKFCNEKYNVTDLNACKPYIQDYINHLSDNNYSSYTQKSYLSGYRKFYQEKFEDIKTDSRKRSQIKRSRFDTESSRHFSETRNSELVNFCQKTGLRRSELEHLRGGCVSLHDDGNYYIDNVKGKGGKIRDVRILDNDQQIIERINNTPSDQFVWGKVHSKANIHGYRADYAMTLYKQLERPLNELERKDKYYCQNEKAGVVYDRGAMRIVSNNLGHNRVGIIAQNYLYK